MSSEGFYGLGRRSCGDWGRSDVLTFSSPVALWALLGLPVVLAIHFLQRRSRREVITTLFLLQQMRRESEQGNRIERLRHSLPLWLQLLMVLVLTWLLAGPRWQSADQVLRVALVLDDTASMSAFQPEAVKGVEKALSELVGLTSRAELTLMTTAAETAALYHGGSAVELRAALAQWQPRLGTHELSSALRSARSLVGEKGTVLMITDHLPAQPLPFQAAVLAVGQPLANVGWSGVTVEVKEGQVFWRALVRNHSAAAQEREWRVVNGPQASAWTKITLEPQESRTLSGPFLQAAEEKLMLELTPDALTLDDRLPLLRPQMKPLALHLPKPTAAAAVELRELFQRYAGTTVTEVAAQADVRVLIWPPSTALADDQHACLFSTPNRAENPPYLTGTIVAEAHALTDGLNWQSLLVREGMVMPRDARDRVLVWQGERPLISLRVSPLGARQLFCHFDLATSNARKLPALAVLVHRFLEEVRQAKIAPERANHDTRQRLTVAHLRGEKAAPLLMKDLTQQTQVEIPLRQAHLLRAPAQPGFFEVMQGERLLLSGSAHFADTREADLQQAASFDNLASLSVVQSETTHVADPQWRLWLLLLAALLLASWFSGRQVV